MTRLAIAQPLMQTVRDLRSGELLSDDYLDTLEANFHEREPSVIAFLPEDSRFERLRSQANALLSAHPNPFTRPPLFCVPVGIKDIFHTDGFDTKAGSDLPVNVLTGRESRVVTALKDAGALIMGKTVTTEFAYFAPGPTKNPHHGDFTPGGSSSGSAAAVAANLCPISTGSQTIGSIIRPASYCGIVGYKPSYDRLSRSGVIPLSPSLDHIGIFANDISAVDLVASILCPDWQIAVAERLPVLGIPEGPYLERASAEGLAHFRDTCRRLTSFGYRIRSEVVMEEFEGIESSHRKIVAAEAAQVHAGWYAEYGHLYHDRTRELIERGMEINVRELADALAGRQRLRRQLISWMDALGIDLWISPAARGPAERGIGSTGDPIMNLPWTYAGLPAVCLPSGWSVEGLPMGLQVVGRWYGDEVLMERAAKLERFLSTSVQTEDYS